MCLRVSNGLARPPLRVPISHGEGALSPGHMYTLAAPIMSACDAEAHVGICTTTLLQADAAVLSKRTWYPCPANLQDDGGWAGMRCFGARKPLAHAASDNDGRKSCVDTHRLSPLKFGHACNVDEAAGARVVEADARNMQGTDNVRPFYVPGEGGRRGEMQGSGECGWVGMCRGGGGSYVMRCFHDGVAAEPFPLPLSANSPCVFAAPLALTVGFKAPSRWAQSMQRCARERLRHSAGDGRRGYRGSGGRGWIRVGYSVTCRDIRANRLHGLHDYTDCMDRMDCTNHS